MTSSLLQNTKLELLRQLFASATHDASAAICRWTNSMVRLTLDEVRELPLDGVCDSLGLGDEQRTMVVLTIHDEIGGTLILTFENGDDRRLAASLLGLRVNWSEPWSELEKSALMETGNILGCAYVSAISRLINRSLIPSVPAFIQDFGSAVLDQALLAQPTTTDTVLICRTGFRHAGESLSWSMLFIPTMALCEVMENAVTDTICR